MYTLLRALDAAHADSNAMATIQKQRQGHPIKLALGCMTPTTDDLLAGRSPPTRFIDMNVSGAPAQIPGEGRDVPPDEPIALRRDAACRGVSTASVPPCGPGP